jgi:hypothetical protein
MAIKITVGLRKACKCEGTSSGPRDVNVLIPGECGESCWMTTIVMMACDVCDKPFVQDNDKFHGNDKPESEPAGKGLDQ